MQRLDPLIHPNVPPDCRRAFRSTIVIPNPLAIPRADISADRLLPNQKIFESRFESGWRWIGLTQQRSAITRGLFTAIRIASAALCSVELAIELRRLLAPHAGLSRDKSTQSHYHEPARPDFSFCEACEEKERLSPACRTVLVFSGLLPQDSQNTHREQRADVR